MHRAWPTDRWKLTERTRSGVGGVVLLAVFVGVASAMTGCVRLPRLNPAYPASDSQVNAEIERMEENPIGVERPVVVLGGWRSPAPMIKRMAERIEALTGAEDADVVPMSYFWTVDIEPLGERLVELVEERWPSDDPDLTTEVDVVALSMGGLVARFAATDRENGAKRLRIGTLYTLATPHRGAKITEVFRVDPASRQMRPGSAFLDRLDNAGEDRPYEIVPYATLNDMIVGATNASPPGQEPVWTPGRLLLSHSLISRDERILTDIAARLRGESSMAGASTPPHD